MRSWANTPVPKAAGKRLARRRAKHGARCNTVFARDTGGRNSALDVTHEREEGGGGAPVHVYTRTSRVRAGGRQVGQLLRQRRVAEAGGRRGGIKLARARSILRGIMATSWNALRGTFLHAPATLGGLRVKQKTDMRRDSESTGEN